MRYRNKGHAQIGPYVMDRTSIACAGPQIVTGPGLRPELPGNHTPVPQAQRSRNSRLRSIDFLRGIAALAVVLHHAVNFDLNLPTAQWLRVIHAVLNQGCLGVPLFFVISGFCIHLTWTRNFKETGQASVQFVKFWKRRLHRLYPPYFVMLCLAMSVVAGELIFHHVAALSDYPTPHAKWILADFLAHVGMLHGLYPVFDEAGGNPPCWTLAREEYFYLMYFILLAVRRRWGLACTITLPLALGIVFQAAVFMVLPTHSTMFLPAGYSWWEVLNTSAIVLWIQWALGMVAVEAHYGLVKLPRAFSSIWLVPVWIICAHECDIHQANHLSILSPLCWGMVFFTILNYVTALERGHRWPEYRWVSWLSGVGVFSYSLYLVHHPVRNLLRNIITSHVNTANPYTYMLVTIFLAVAGFYAAKVYFHFVESKFINRPRPDTQPVRSPGTVGPTTPAGVNQ